MKFYISYTERRENVKTHIVEKPFDTIESAIEYAYRLDNRKFKIEILNENHEIVKEF
jgi:dihydroneopterin aldolase